MTDEKWFETVGRVKDQFRFIEERSGPLDDGPGTKDTLVFETRGGVVKLERVTRPVLLGERGIGGKRIGATVAIERAYSEDETIQSLHAYRQQGDAWIPLDAAFFTEEDGTKSSSQ